MTAAFVSAISGVLADGKFGEAAYFIPYMAVVAAAFWAVRRKPVGERGPWAWVAGSQLLLLTGDAVFAVSRWHEWPDHDVAEAALWTAGSVAYGVALVAMGRRRAGRWLRSAVLDTLTLVTAATMVIWVVFVSPYLTGAGGNPVEMYLSIVAPLGDVIFLAGVLLIVFSPGYRGGATGLLILAAALRIVADLGSYFIPSLDLAIAASTATILLSNALLVGAALHPGAGELTTLRRQARTVHPARPWFLGLALLSAPTVLFLRRDYATTERTILFAATVVTVMFVVIRFASAVRSLERIERELSFQASHDPLTGLLNRAALAAHLEAAEPSSSTVLYLDLDGFKAVNDQAGHAAGDAILCAVSDRLTRAVRDGDAVARLGGDEFAVVLHDVTRDEAVVVAERILRDVALPVEYNGTAYTVGTSIGLAEGRLAEWSPAALLRAADAAMYEAKSGGRNRWVAAGSPA